MIISDDSTVTLVLEADNPCNTTITDIDTGKTVYAIKTYYTDKKTWTEIKGLCGEVVATAEWRDLRADIITLWNGPKIPQSAWLKKSNVPFKDTVYFEDLEGRKFKWKRNGPDMSLECFASDDKRNPVARFVKPKRYMNDETDPPSRAESPATIHLDLRGADMQDLIVISWCFLEKSRRARERPTLNRADGKAEAG
ncbi:hypothetical protein PLICRDRAFT_52976 [Plicaturopsis crispa FD-325 SS-3]|nr:hypothetical protein PLICRDRAFT_52976 [Plicaturopsis crispa FD-325 SS-3]